MILKPSRVSITLLKVNRFAKFAGLNPFIFNYEKVWFHALLEFKHWFVWNLQFVILKPSRVGRTLLNTNWFAKICLYFQINLGFILENVMICQIFHCGTLPRSGHKRFSDSFSVFPSIEKSDKETFFKSPTGNCREEKINLVLSIEAEKIGHTLDHMVQGKILAQ